MNAQAKKTLNRFAGFSLIEISIVLLILGLIVGGGFTTIGSYLDNSKQNYAMSNLQATKKSMLNYVMVNYHMPCPDTNNDGLENRESDESCSSSTGLVPYIDIGRSRAGASDDYNNVFAYGISANATTIGNMTTLTGPSTEEQYGDLEASEAFYQEAQRLADPSSDNLLSLK